MLVYVTGTPGVGKSTARAALAARGYETYDVDDDGFAAHFNVRTGIRVDTFVHGRKWQENNEWRIYVDRVSELARQTGDQTAFLFGTARNNEEVFPLCSRIIALDVAKSIVRKRLSSRGNRFGAEQEEVELALEWQEKERRCYKQLGIPIIDTAQLVNEVANEIIELAKI